MKSIHITTEQYQRLRHEEQHGKLQLKMCLIEDEFEMSDCCYLRDDGQGYDIDEGAYKYCEQQGFVW